MSRPGTVLVVEDDPGAAESLQYVREDEGHKVMAARIGEEGLALAGTERCDLVLTDLKLPGLSGLDLVKRLHAARPRRAQGAVDGTRLSDRSQRSVSRLR